MKRIRAFDQFLLNEAYGEWGFKQVKAHLEEIAATLEHPLEELKKEPIVTRGYPGGTRYYYKIHNVEIVVANTKCIGAPRFNSVDVFVLTEPGSTKGTPFSSTGGFDRLRQCIEDKYDSSASDVITVKENQWTKAKLQSLVNDLKKREEPIEDDGLFDVVDGIFATEEGLEEYIRDEMGIKDPQGWFVSQIA